MIKNKHSILMATAAVSAIVFGSSIVINNLQQQQAFAVTTAEIEEKNLKEARRALQEGNTTSAIDNILTILEWEFKEVHPREAASSPGGNVTAVE